MSLNYALIEFPSLFLCFCCKSFYCIWALPFALAPDFFESGVTYFCSFASPHCNPLRFFHFVNGFSDDRHVVKLLGF
jgi:hypothetical protein